EAAQAVIVGDPIWCPATVKIPTPNLNGCSGSHATFALLFADPIFSGGGPGKDGIIWVESSYTGEAFTVDVGSALASTNLKDFKLTINGGWAGCVPTCVSTLNPNAPSVFTTPLIITGWNNDITINNISILGSSAGALYSLHVETTKNITLNNVEISTTSDGGAWLVTDIIGSTGNVTVNNSKFNNITDANGGLRIDSRGTVTLKNVEAKNNGTGGVGIGILIYNQMAVTPKNVTITNLTVSNNQNDGLLVNSKGVITVTDLTATNNGLSGSGNGATLNNLAGVAAVNVNGTNLFHSNDDFGLQIQTHGAIKVNNIHAVDNGSNGANLVNNTAATPQPVTLTGSNTLKFNGFNGLNIISLGTVTLNNITADSNANRGVFVDNDESGANGDVKLTGTNFFNNNMDTGLVIYSTGAIMLNNLTANKNLVYGAYLDNTASATFKSVTITGVNQFNENTDSGLLIISDGIVTLNNITANGNGGNVGVNINNTTSTPAKPMGVTMAGTNLFNNNNGTGLGIYSHGAVTLNNITANFNGVVNTNGYGLDVRNDVGTTTPANVTINGANTLNGNYSGGINVWSLGIIKANSLTVKDTVDGIGAYFQNSIGTSTAGVMLTGTNIFTGNKQTNLVIYSYGAVSLNNITASNSLSNHGLFINNSGATSKSVTLTGTNVFNGNWFSGVTISSIGAITLNNVTANNNGVSGTGGYGTYLDNTLSPVNAGITLNGTNNFNGNYQTGLYIITLGNIKINNITANGTIATSHYGANMSNLNGTGSVTLTGVNTFSGNKGTNLFVYSAGVITINNLTANNSVNGQGAYIDNTASGASAPKAVTLTGNNTFNGNAEKGLDIYTFGAITTNNLTANGNGIGSNNTGVKLDNSNGTIPMPIAMKGNNTFTGNYGLNLVVYSLGAITANNVTANDSVNHYGATFQNYFAGASGNVTLTGTNSFSGNLEGGLTISTKGAITISNVTANNNSGGFSAILLNNTYTTPTVTNKPITILGYSVTNNNTVANGLHIETYSAITLNNVTTNNNGFYGLFVLPGLGATIPINVTLNGINQANDNMNTGIYINTPGGNVTINNLTASDNNSYGLRINAINANQIGANITLKGTNVFNGNSNIGVEILTHGAVVANNVTVKNTVSAGGMSIYSGGGMTPKPVTLTGINTFSGNNGDGLSISAGGAVTLSNITASTNTSNGVLVIGDDNVTLTGKNQFNNNTSSGLEVFALGNITISNLTAHNNGIYGVNLDNSTGANTTKITITGVNSFVNNTNTGLRINSVGSVTITKITADKNGNSGVWIDANNVTLTCGSFVNNTGYGLRLNVQNATLTGIVAAGNTTGNYDFTVSGTLTQKHGCPLP
ncbi:MAG: hypothetical protein JNJ43_00470, partial [Anaerolineales bacterium]|nr:hypothetical protein [Anaerolineales bacterium]